LNGNKQGDEEGEWTYMDSRGETVIPYDRIVNEEAWQRGEEFRLGGRVDSDHLEIALRKRRGRTEQRRKGVGNRNKTVFLSAVLSVKKKKRSKKDEREDGKRKFKNKVENAEGKRVLEWLKENGWEGLNGNKQGEQK
jgi:hypothetical protein